VWPKLDNNENITNSPTGPDLKEQPMSKLKSYEQRLADEIRGTIGLTQHSEKVQSKIGLVGAWMKKCEGLDVGDDYEIEDFLREQEQRLEREYMRKEQHNKLMLSQAEAHLKNIEKGILLYRDDVEREYVKRPIYGMTDAGQVGWHCGTSNQIATMLNDAKGLVENWCVCCPRRATEGHPEMCKKDRWEPVFVKALGIEEV
jgi:hypothetical protein